MNRLLLFISGVAVACAAAFAADLKPFETKAFAISIPADWEVSYYGDEWMNASDADDEISFNIAFNDQGPTKAQLQEAVDNWVYMMESHGNKVDQKMVKDDYALVRAIITDEDDGTQSVEVWYLMISSEPQGFSGTITSTMERANEALDILVAMLATLEPK